MVVVITKRTRRRVNHMLTKTLGHPAHTTEAERMAMRRLLDGWLGQFIKGDKQKGNVPWSIQLNSPRARPAYGDDPLLKFGWLAKRLASARLCFLRSVSMGRWRVAPMVHVTSQIMAPHTTHDWSLFQFESKRQLTIAIAPLYQETVAKHGLCQDGRKIVQAIWDHRDYGDMQVWQCRYWDLSELTNDESTHVHAKQYEGYVAKTGTHIAVEQDFEKAIAVARRRTVQGVVRQIVKEYSDDKPV